MREAAGAIRVGREDNVIAVGTHDYTAVGLSGQIRISPAEEEREIDLVGIRNLGVVDDNCTVIGVVRAKKGGNDCTEKVFGGATPVTVPVTRVNRR